MTPPVLLVFKSDDVIDEIANEPVVVAFVVVLTFIVKPLMVDDAAWTLIPIVVVGVSDPATMFQSLKLEVR